MICPEKAIGSEAVAGHYDSLDEFYLDVWGPHLHHGFWETGHETTEEAVAHLSQTVLDGAQIRPRDHVCDVGCGHGALCWQMAREFSAEVVGYTLSARQRDAARKGDAKGLKSPPTFHLCDWLKNGLADEWANAVVSIECVSHVWDKSGFLSEIARVLKPGGRLSMAAWLSKEHPSVWETRWLLEPICVDGRLAGLLSLNEYCTRIEAAGLRVVEARDIGPQVSKTWRVITSRILRRLLSRREYRQFLWSNMKSDRKFALTFPRIMTAYTRRALGYGLIVAEKPGCTSE